MEGMWQVAHRQRFPKLQVKHARPRAVRGGDDEDDEDDDDDGDAADDDDDDDDSDDGEDNDREDDGEDDDDDTMVMMIPDFLQETSGVNPQSLSCTEPLVIFPQQE